jgi:hypothetical protein
MTFLQTIKSLPTSLRAAAAAVTAIGTILAGGLAFDSRYASAADVQAIQRDVQQQVQATQKSFTGQILIQRQQQLEDQIFVIEAKREKTQKVDKVDEAIHARALRQLQQVQQQQLELQKEK